MNQAQLDPPMLNYVKTKMSTLTTNMFFLAQTICPQEIGKLYLS